MNMLRRIIYVSAVALVAGSNLQAQPDLIIRSDRFKFGVVPAGETVSHHYWFHSVGTDTVIIHNVENDCDCTMAPLQKNWIAPDDSMKIEFCWAVPNIVGPRGNYPTISTNADKGHPYMVYMTGTASKLADSVQPAAFKPYVFNLSRFGAKSIDSISFSILNFTSNDIGIQVVSYSVDECDISLPDSVEANSVSYGFVKVKPEYLDKEFKKSFTVEYSDPNRTRFTVPVRRRIY